MRIKFDPLLNKLRVKDVIPQVTSDPANANGEDAWVLRTGANSGGGIIKSFMGLGFPYMSAQITSYSYQLSYKTQEGTIKRVTLS